MCFRRNFKIWTGWPRICRFVGMGRVSEGGNFGHLEKFNDQKVKKSVRKCTLMSFKWTNMIKEVFQRVNTRPLVILTSQSSFLRDSEGGQCRNDEVAFSLLRWNWLCLVFWHYSAPQLGQTGIFVTLIHVVRHVWGSFMPVLTPLWR